jgi:hypothetical protein
MPRRFKHNKTGNVYLYLYKALDTTNNKPLHTRWMVVYQPVDINADLRIYVREEQEFLSKFTEI